jgi:hypothetical protein
LKVKHAIRVFETIEGWRDIKLYLTHIVFTLPKELWLKVVEDCDSFFEAVYEALRYPGGLSGGVAALHLWHSEDPLSGFYPHIHVIVPNVVVVKNGKLKWFRRVKPFFNERLLKERFRLSLIKKFNVSVDSVDIYLRYVRFKDRGQVIHVLNYAFRLPIEDFAPYLRSGLPKEVRDFVLSVVNFKKHRIRWFGWLSDSVKSHYMRFVRFKEFVEEVTGICPIHRVKLMFVEHVVCLIDRGRGVKFKNV